MERKNELKGLIYRQFPTEAAMARKLNWPAQRLNAITTGRKIPDLKEVSAIADILNKPFSYIASFFLPHESTVV